MHKFIWVYITRISAIFAVLFLLVFIYFGKTDATSNDAWLFNGSIFIVWALVHSFMSTAGFKKFYAKIFPSRYLRSTFIIISGIGLMGVIYHWQPLQGGLWQLHGSPRYISTILFILFAGGAAINLYAIDYKEFIGIKNLQNNDTPNNPEAEKSDLSLKGMYGYCRHPTYLFLILLFWATPTMTYTKLEFVVLATLYLFIGTFHEETNLRKELGRQYDVYCENVPMWLPRLKQWKPSDDSL